MAYIRNSLDKSYKNKNINTMHYVFIVLVYLASSIYIYALTDFDGNGISDIWELKYLNRIGINPERDNDNDGYNNLDESIAGTDPTHQQRYIRGESNTVNFSSGILEISGIPFTGTNSEHYIYYYWWGVAGKKYRPVWSQDLINYFPYKNSENEILEFYPNTHGELGFVVRIDKVDTDGDGEADTAYEYAPNVSPPGLVAPAMLLNMQNSLESTGLVGEEGEMKPVLHITMAGGWYGLYSRINFNICGNGNRIDASVVSDINLWAMVRGTNEDYIIEYSDYYLRLTFAGGFSVYTLQDIEEYPCLLEEGVYDMDDDTYVAFVNYLENKPNSSTSRYFITTNGLSLASTALVNLAMGKLHQIYDTNRQIYITAYNNWENKRNLELAQSLAMVASMSTESTSNTPVSWYPDETSATAMRNTGRSNFIRLEVSDIEEADGRTKAERLEVANSDTNANGIPDWWENWHFGKILTTSEASISDYDSDGINDIDEYKLIVMHNKDSEYHYDNNSMLIGADNNLITRDKEGNITSRNIQ